MQHANESQRTIRKLPGFNASRRLLDVCAMLLTSLAAFAGIADVSGDEGQLEVPVRLLSASQPTTPADPMMAAREPAPEATPAARMPQYQLHHNDIEDHADPTLSQLRFVLAMPNRPLLIEASVLIDGQPFRQAREKRVQEIMRYIAEPAAYRDEQARRLAEVQAKRDALEQASQLQATILQTISDLLIGSDSAEDNTAPDQEPAPNPDVPSPSEDLKPLEIPAAEDPPAEDPAAEDQTPEPIVAETPAEPAVPAVPKYTAPATIYDRIDRYTQSTGSSPTVDEVRWLLTNWVDGPQLLFLNDNFQRFRADQQPVYKVLDRDRSGKVSADEVAQAVVSFRECDLNRDDIVEATELATAAKDVRDQAKSSSTGKLVFRLPEGTDAATFLRRLATLYSAAESRALTVPRFDTDANGVLSAEELTAMQTGPADIRLRVEFNTAQPDSSKLIIEEFAHEFASLKDSAKRNPSSLTLSFPAFSLEFMAAQGSSSDHVSIGAVNDGYAMLQEIDPNSDGRFSIRELRQLNDRLAAFDRDSDGQITSDETRPTYRVCFGLGPTAHQPLALLRDVNAPASATQIAGPDWFTEMDKNNDNDLTRQEFPGTDEQFKELDTDADELISSEEANHSTAKRN